MGVCWSSTSGRQCRIPCSSRSRGARRSVLEAYAGKSIYPNHGRRVVAGYRMMQSASDTFLGWTKGKLGRHVYARQLKDMKVAPHVDVFSPGLDGRLCRVLRVGAGVVARARRRAGTDQRLPRQERRLRQSHRGVRQRLRRSKRTRPCNLEEGGALRTGGSSCGRGIGAEKGREAQAFFSAKREIFGIGPFTARSRKRQPVPMRQPRQVPNQSFPEGFKVVHRSTLSGQVALRQTPKIRRSRSSGFHHTRKFLREHNATSGPR